MTTQALLLSAALITAAASARARAEDPTPPPTAPDLTTAPPPVTPASPVASEPAPQVVEKAAKPSHGFFPLWGDKVRAKGFELPPPFGFMVNYYYQKSAVDIGNLKLGLNDGPMYDASFIQFGESTARAQALAIRPNVMILPFLSVYAVISSGSSSTNVVLTDPAAFTTTAESGAFVVALGATFQMAWKGWFAVADFNAALADVDRIADLMGSNLLSFRLGRNWRFGPDGRGVAVWAGTSGQVIDVATEGSVRLGEVLPPPQQSTIDEVQARCDALGPLDPSRIVCNALVQQLQDWRDNGYEGTVQYSLDKQPKDVWNMVAGAQFAWDRNWQFRAEFGFLGSRTSALLAVEYRFDIVL